MKKRQPLIPDDLRPRVVAGLSSATGAAVFFGFFASAPLSWNSPGYWLFVAAVFCLAFWLYGRVD